MPRASGRTAQFFRRHVPVAFGPPIRTPNSCWALTSVTGGCLTLQNVGRVWPTSGQIDDSSPERRKYMKVRSWVESLVGASALLLPARAATTLPQTAATSEPERAQITVLYDAFGKTSAMQKDWGFAALVESGGKRVLFDTGNNPEILAKNVKTKGIDLSTLDFVVMSHRHGDHMGGMSYLLQ